MCVPPLVVGSSRWYFQVWTGLLQFLCE